MSAPNWFTSRPLGSVPVYQCSQIIRTGWHLRQCRHTARHLILANGQLYSVRCGTHVADTLESLNAHRARTLNKQAIES